MGSGSQNWGPSCNQAQQGTSDVGLASNDALGITQQPAFGLLLKLATYCSPFLACNLLQNKHQQVLGLESSAASHRYMYVVGMWRGKGAKDILWR